MSWPRNLPPTSSCRNLQSSRTTKEGSYGRFDHFWVTGRLTLFNGTVLVGIRDVSRDLEFQSSYTLVEHAPEDSIELEIKPYALRQIEKLRKAWEENNFAELFELLGTKENQSVLEVGDEPASEYTSSEYTVAEGALVADGTGYMSNSVRQPSPPKGAGSMGIPALHQWWVSSSWLRTGGRWLPGAVRRRGLL